MRKLFNRFALLVFAALNLAGHPMPLSEKVDELVQEIKAEPPGQIRLEDAEHLSNLLWFAPMSDINDKMIDEVASLLGNGDGGVKYWAAIALGHLGPRAKSALPALEEALRHAHPPTVATPPILSTAIQAAIENINKN